MFQKKLVAIEKDYKEISDKLANPEIFSDPQKSGKLLKKQAELTGILQDWRQYQKLNQRLDEAKEFADDPDLADDAAREIKKLEAKITSLTQALEESLKPKDPNDARDIILEIRAGAGGDEAGLFAGSLFRMYSRLAETKNWKINILNSNNNDVGGFKEVVAEILGDGVYGLLKFESGVHRVQRIPTTEKGGRIHTSTATVAVLPIAEEKEVSIKPEDLKFDVFRSSGPGGQSVNTTDSAVRVTHLPTGMTVSCQDEKSQHKNKAKALRILEAKLIDLEITRQQKEASDKRKNQIGTGDRSEKIRTYNFPQNRITDHRIKKSWHNIESVLDGDLDDVLSSLQKAANS